MSRQPELSGESHRIAVVGMACRVPGAKNVDEFWRNLREGLEADLRVELSEWADTVDLPVVLMDRPGMVPARPRIEGVDLFDAAFFGYTPREAQALDPQQRLFLECAWEALESAGYDSERYPGAIGVSAGVSQSSYLMHYLQWDKELLEGLGTLNVGIGNMNDSLATRVAYKLNLRGPAYAVQCFCSTSLVAIHLACQSLRTGESDMVLAGGVTISVPQSTGYMYQEGGILSPDGHTRTFDAKGQGMAFGNGLGIVVLKRLEDALRDNDNIRAVVLGSAVNNDGSLKVGYTAPSVSGQARVIEQALRTTGVHPETIGYVEAHGTATSLGDPAEIAGLTKAYRKWTDKSGYCAIGSVKTNIGHLDAAAGVAGFIKATLALENQEIPANLHFESPNSQIDFEGSPFYVSTRLEKWEAGDGPRRSGLSSFGFGGTNAHAILEEAPPRQATDPARPHQLLVLSARTEKALDRATANLAEHLASRPEANLADVAYTLQVGRRVFNHRRAVVVRDVEDAKGALSDPARWDTATQDRQHAPVVFMFTGQGSQYVGMAKGLYEGEAAFREAVDECCRILRERAGLDLLPVLYPNEPNENESEAAASRLKETEVTQPALFAIEYATARLLSSWGVEPTALIGHSIGEYVAAHVAGVFTLEDALTLVAERGRLMQSLPAGAMLAVPLSEEAVAPYLGSGVDLASANAPASSVLSGPFEAIERVERELGERGVMSRRLQTSHAFHSAMMDPILAEFEKKVGAVEARPPRIPFISNVTGRWIEPQRATAKDYWAEHLRSAVRFYQGVGTLLEETTPVLVEVGPGNTLGALARQLPRQDGPPTVVTTLRHPKETRDDRAFFLAAMGRLWLSGAHIEWSGVHERDRRRRVPLPTYPFERERYWVKKNEEMQKASEIVNGFTYRRPKIEDWFYQPSWHRFLPSELCSEPKLLESNRWLVFEDGLGAAAGFEEELQSRGQKFVRVAFGDSFSGDETAGFTLRPGERGDYLALFQALLAKGGPPTHVAHFGSLTAASDGRDIEERLSESQERGFESLLYLGQALARSDVKTPIRLLVLTNGVFDVVGSELLLPEKATMLGPCRVIPQELRNVGCWLVDVETSGTGFRLPKQQALWLLSDLHLEEDEQPRIFTAVAYRSGQRWMTHPLPTRLREVTTTRIRENGVYLVTGGLGGIGLVLAEHLARKYRARIVLTGRSALPPREAWAKDEPRCAKLLALEEAGAEVLYVPADVAKVEDMVEVVRRARERFGPIQGVIHSAGVPGGGIIQLKEPAEAARVMAPKLQGTLALRRSLASEPLDFMVLCSSTAAWFGGVGQVDYCGANAFLDAYAASVRNEGGPYTVSINWDTWKEVGMAVNTRVSGAMKAIRDLNLSLGISPEEGVEAFERILVSGLTQVAAFTQDLKPRLLHTWVAVAKPKPGPGDGASSPDSRESVSDDAALDQGGEAPNDIEVVIQGVWKKVLGRKQIGINDNFFELGGDSLTAIQVVSLLKSRIGREVPIVTFYEAPTVALLTKALTPKESEERVEENLAEVGQRAETRLQLMRERRRRGRGPAALED